MKPDEKILRAQRESDILDAAEDDEMAGTTLEDEYLKVFRERIRRAREDSDAIPTQEPEIDADMEEAPEKKEKDDPIKISRLHYTPDFVERMEKNGQNFEYEDIDGVEEAKRGFSSTGVYRLGASGGTNKTEDRCSLLRSIEVGTVTPVNEVLPCLDGDENIGKLMCLRLFRVFAFAFGLSCQQHSSSSHRLRRCLGYWFEKDDDWTHGGSSIAS